MGKPIERELPSAQSTDSQKRVLIYLLGAGVLTILIIVLLLVLFLLPAAKKTSSINQLTANTPTPTPTLTPTPTPTPGPLPTGPVTYSVSSGSTSIILSQIYISALDTKIGDPQTMRLTIADSKAPVNYVVVKLVTDKKSETHTLSLKSGNGSNGVWEGTWTTDTPHDYIYQAQITIKDQAGDTIQNTPSFR